MGATNGVPARDTGHAPDTWEFDDEVTRVFDDMLARSIPQYEIMRRAVFDLACRHQEDHTAIVDLGCSRGGALAPFVERFGARNQHIGAEISRPMVAAARERFAGYIGSGVVDIRCVDVSKDYPPWDACITLSVLTLMFTPIESRQRIVHNAYRWTKPGGCFIVVEKILGSSADLNQAMVELYHGMKAEQGYSLEDIERKRLSLQGVLVPVTAAWNEQMLRSAGFRQVDCFWRWMNFAGWMAIKE